MKIFAVGVKALLRRGENVLLLVRADPEGLWDLPGGRVEGSESLEEALHRELGEELPGIRNVAIGELVACIRVGEDLVRDLGLLLVFYEIDAELSESPELSDEHSAYRWTTPAEAAELIGPPFRRVFVRD